MAAGNPRTNPNSTTSLQWLRNLTPTQLRKDGEGTLLPSNLERKAVLRRNRYMLGDRAAGEIHDQTFETPANNTVRKAMDAIEGRLATLSYPDFPRANAGPFQPALLGAMWDALRSYEAGRGLGNV